MSGIFSNSKLAKAIGIVAATCVSLAIVSLPNSAEPKGWLMRPNYTIAFEEVVAKDVSV